MDDDIISDSATDNIDPTPEKASPPEWLVNILVWAGNDPWGFVGTVFLYLSPLFVISALLSWKLAKMIDAKEKETKKNKTKNKNLRNIRKTKAE